MRDTATLVELLEVERAHWHERTDDVDDERRD